MVQLCSRCQRANPDRAVFCHFDGCMLGQKGGPGGIGVLLQEFIFPSGRRCRTFDELVQGCYNEWEEARQLLKDGTFTSFLAGVGRADLSRAAREASGQPDPDIALTNFVDTLPATQVQKPKLGLSPRKLVVGPVRVGEQRAVQVKLINEGQGLLQGKVTVIEGQSWLKLADSNDSTCAVKTPREQLVSLRADTAALVVGQNYPGKLQIVTNGGVAEVPIRLDLVVKPFARAPYAGASNPRDLARRMSKDPDPAVNLLESGEVRRWFASNGWAYPVAGTPAPGRASVQQFFEELGLAKPPPIALSEQEFRFRATAPEVVAGQVTMRTSARRIVYGRIESDSPWLKVKTPSVAGDFQTTIGFEVDSGQMDGDRLHQGNLKIIANAGQAFHVRVQVEVQGGKKGWLGSPRPGPAPVSPPVAPPPPVVTQQAAPRAINSPPPPGPAWLPAQPPPPTQRVTAQPPGAFQFAPPPPAVVPRQAAPAGGLGQAILVGTLLGFIVRLAMIFPADLFARLLGGGSAPGSLAAWLQAPPAEAFLRLFVLATWWLGALGGAVLVWRAGGRVLDVLCGLLAGAILGLVGCATLGCLLVAVDALPRGLLALALGSRTLGPAAATPLWFLTAITCWTILGAGLGLVLGALGSKGTAVLAVLTSPVAGLLRLAGLGKAADFFALRGG